MKNGVTSPTQLKNFVLNLFPVIVYHSLRQVRCQIYERKHFFHTIANFETQIKFNDLTIGFGLEIKMTSLKN